MIIETLFVGRNNTFSLQLLRAEEAVNLLGITGYALNLSNGLAFNDQIRFTEKDNGVVEIAIGDLLTLADVGTHKAHLVTFDAVNVEGIRWPDFKIKVKA